MPQSFGAETTADEVLEGVSLAGRRILVTGVSAGLGVETARALAARGASVVGAARDLGKARGATIEVAIAAQAAGGSFELIELDLASLASVRAAAAALLADERPFDVVIANAGVMATPEGRTRDGFETQFGANHLGRFVFVNRIAALLQGAATTAWAATVAPAQELGGRYCEDCHVAAIQDGEGVRGGVRPHALDPERAQALWARSEALVGERF